MLPLKIVDHDLISFSFSPQSLVCAWLQKTKTASTALLQLRAYKHIPLTNSELENITLFNPTRIKHTITDFLTTHKKKNASISFCLNGPGVTQQYISLPKTHPTDTDLGITPSSARVSHYKRMYYYDGQSLFYVYTLERALILQYQLLAIAAELNLLTITTAQSALFNFYRYTHGSAFRQTQLALDMARCHNRLERLISTDTVRRVINLPPGFPLQEFIHLATACGLFIAEEHHL